MRKISPDEIESINDAVTADLVKGLSPAVLEKDLHITAALSALSNLTFSHTAHLSNWRKGDPRPRTETVKSRLIFAGGTCLSKGYGLISRMSEDIDLKIVLDEPSEGYIFPSSEGNRKRLGDIHSSVREALQKLDFVETSCPGSENPTSRDTRRYYHLSVQYLPEFEDVSGALRPELKIELIHRHPKLPSVKRELNNLIHGFIPQANSTPLEIDCISIEEALGEKVLSLLRRCAWKWSGHQKNEMDSALVRHVYDVWKIDTLQPESKSKAKGVFQAIVETDSHEFKGQNPEFDASPIAVLQKTLKILVSERRLETEFNTKLRPLLFSNDKVDYLTCLRSFESVANFFIDSGKMSES